jgi:hypothetical protein
VGRKARPEAVTVTELKGHPAPVAAVDWSHDLSLLASGDIKGMVAPQFIVNKRGVLLTPW